MSMHSPSHPGDIVRDLIDEANLTIVAAAELLNVSRAQLTRLLGQKSGISPEMALKLETVFGSTAENWMRLQDAWELAKARRNADKITAGLRRFEPAHA